MKLTSEFTKHVELAQQEHEYYISATKKSETQLAISLSHSCVLVTPGA